MGQAGFGRAPVEAAAPISVHSSVRSGEWLFVVLIPLWLFFLIFPAIIATDRRQLLQAVSLAWPIPFCLHFGRSHFLYSAIHRSSFGIRVLTLIFVLAYVVSSALSVDPSFSLTYAVVTTVGLMLCWGLWSCINWRMETALGAFGILGSTLAVYAFGLGASVQGRLTFGAAGTPNLLGIVCFGSLVCSLAIRNLAIRGSLVSLNALAILATQGRSCLIASAISILVFVLLTLGKRRHAMVSFVAILVMTLGIVAIYRQELAAGFSAVLFLNDPSRGVGTGFTGRLDAWQEAYRIFLDNPIFGVGFRTHEQYMQTLPTAHNGYLSILAETGAFGLTTTLTLIGFCTARLFRAARSGDRTAILGFSFVCGYLFVAMFERILVNFGSPTSVLMWMFLFMPKWPRPGIQPQHL